MSEGGAVRILERAMVVAKDRLVSPLQVLSFVWDIDADAMAHAQAMHFVFKVMRNRGATLTYWWTIRERTREELVALFDDALFEARLQ